VDEYLNSDSELSDSDPGVQTVLWSRISWDPGVQTVLWSRIRLISLHQNDANLPPQIFFIRIRLSKTVLDAYDFFRLNFSGPGSGRIRIEFSYARLYS
jgi:hypothetical protein